MKPEGQNLSDFGSSGFGLVLIPIVTVPVPAEKRTRIDTARIDLGGVRSGRWLRELQLPTQREMRQLVAGIQTGTLSGTQRPVRRSVVLQERKRQPLGHGLVGFAQRNSSRETNRCA